MSNLINSAHTQTFIAISADDFDRLLIAIERLEKRLDYYEKKDEALMQSKDDEYITRLQAARLLNVKSLCTVDHYAKKGLLKKYRMGAMVRFKKNEVFAFKSTMK